MTQLSLARAELHDLARSPLSGDAFAARAIAAVRRAVAFDGYCLLGLDPHSGLRSFLFSRNGLDGVADRLAYNEAVEADVNRYSDLARADVPAGYLSSSSPGGSYSPRLHDILRPAGFSSELRLALRHRSRLWGALVLFRGDRRRRFSEKDATAISALAEPLCAAVRRYPVRRTSAIPEPLPPGIVLLDAANAIVSATREAQVWLDDVRAGGQDEVDSDDVLRVVYDVALAARTHGGSTNAICRVRTTSGRWLLVHGASTEPDSTAVAVVLQTPSVRQLLPAVSAWFDLTPREGEVLQLVAKGYPAKHMARALRLSVLTVNDHLGAIYRKASVAGRDEMLALLT